MSRYKGVLPPSPIRSCELLWAEHTVNRIVTFLQVDAAGEINDPRQQKLADLVEAYYGLFRPELFRDRLRVLVDGSGTDENDNFLLHRGRIAKALDFTSIPKTATFARTLLAAFPR